MVAISLATIAACGGDDDGGGRSIDVGYAFGFDAGDIGDQVAFDRLAQGTDIRLVLPPPGQIRARGFGTRGGAARGHFLIRAGRIEI